VSYPFKIWNLDEISGNDWVRAESACKAYDELKSELDKLVAALEKISEMECPYGEGGCDSDAKRRIAWEALSALKSKSK